MFARIRALIVRLQDVALVDDFTETDLKDLGLSRAQLRDLMAMSSEVADRAARMAAIFGLPETALQENRADYLDILNTCKTCRDSRTCDRTFAQGRLTIPTDATFCPNAATYAGLAA